MPLFLVAPQPAVASCSYALNGAVFVWAAGARYNDSQDEHIPLDTVLTTLAEDLVERGKVASVADALAMPRFDFATLLVNTYIAYVGPSVCGHGVEAELTRCGVCALPLAGTRLLPRPCSRTTTAR